jgi:hypothetical protein
MKEYTTLAIGRFNTTLYRGAAHAVLIGLEHGLNFVVGLWEGMRHAPLLIYKLSHVNKD